MKNKYRNLLCRTTGCFFLCGLLLQGTSWADGGDLQLGQQRLFMSSAQRQNIDRQLAPTDVEPDDELSAELAPTKINKTQTIKVTLKGAVIRPDGSAVLFLNDETRIVPRKQGLVSDGFKFAIRVKSKMLTLTPGQTVSIGAGNG